MVFAVREGPVVYKFGKLIETVWLAGLHCCVPRAVPPPPAILGMAPTVVASLWNAVEIVVAQLRWMGSHGKRVQNTCLAVFPYWGGGGKLKLPLELAGLGSSCAPAFAR